jgi:hypothetical protein
MPAPCTVCSHRDREQIDKDLEAGKSTGSIALTYSLAKSSVVRHKKRHLAKEIELRKTAPVAFRVEAQADGLLRTLYRTLRSAENGNRLRLAVDTVRAIDKALRLKLLAERVRQKAHHGMKQNGLIILSLAPGEVAPPLPEGEGIRIVIQAPGPEEAREQDDLDRFLEETRKANELRARATEAKKEAEKPIAVAEPPKPTGKEIFWQAMRQQVLDEADDEDGL